MGNMACETSKQGCNKRRETSSSASASARVRCAIYALVASADRRAYSNHVIDTPVAIRQARKEDESEIDALMNELDEFHVVNLPWLLREKPQSVPYELPPYVDQPGRVTFVAESDGVVGVALVYVRELPRNPRLRPGHIAELDALVVRPDQRRRGVGRALVEATLDWAKAAGVLRTELGVYAFNEAGLRFWRSVGFAPLSHRLYKD